MTTSPAGASALRAVAALCLVTVMGLALGACTKCDVPVWSAPRACHDTPAQQFFAKSRRDFSHGCIRLERPADLAAWVLRNFPDWTPARIHAVMDGTENNIQVNLKQPLPVLILYSTVVVSEDGVVHVFDDIYGHDQALEAALAKGYPYPG